MRTIQKALVVDDDEDVLRLCKVSLQAFTGWSVDVAGSADAAIRAAVRESPDVILLDVMMPGEGGLSLLRRLKGMSATADIPVVLMTAGDAAARSPRGARTSDPAAETGAAGVIWKPFEPSELHGEIVRIVSGEGAL
jgi:two-component system OmpR family response regulator